MKICFDLISHWITIQICCIIPRKIVQDWKERKSPHMERLEAKNWKGIICWILAIHSDLIWFTYLYTSILNPKDKFLHARPTSKARNKFQLLSKKCKTYLLPQASSRSFESSVIIHAYSGSFSHCFQALKLQESPSTHHGLHSLNSKLFSGFYVFYLRFACINVFIIMFVIFWIAWIWFLVQEQACAIARVYELKIGVSLSRENWRGSWAPIDSGQNSWLIYAFSFG